MSVLSALAVDWAVWMAFPDMIVPGRLESTPVRIKERDLRAVGGGMGEREVREEGDALS